MKKSFNERFEEQFPNPRIEKNKLIMEQKNGGISEMTFTTTDDAARALEFARFCQRVGLALLVDIKILQKKV